MPPVIRLIQADDPDAWQRTLLALCLPPAAGGAGLQAVGPLDPPVLIVPSRAAAEQWRLTLERRLLVEGWHPPLALQQALGHPAVGGTRTAVALPRLCTRDQLHEAWHRAARIDAPRLSGLTREVLMGASARRAARDQRPPFLLRPGLVAEMLRLFDQVTRLGHDPVAWLADVGEHLAAQADTDRGAERLLAQTGFLREAFRQYVERVTSTGGVDERALHAALRRSPHAWASPHLIVSVGDHHAHREGLWPVDLELLARAPGLHRIDVVATRRLADGLFPRLRRAWGGTIDVRVPSQRPLETRLEVDAANRRWIACRDREEEVIAYARRAKALAAHDATTSALVFRRPLPYLYVARHVLDAAGIPFDASATLPLAAEPWAASLDLLMDVALSGFTRAALVTLLRSPHVQVRLADGAPVGPSDIADFDRWLARGRYLGTLEHLDALATAAPFAGRSDEVRQAAVARGVAAAIRPLLARMAPLQAMAPAAAHVRTLRDVWRACERLPHDEDPEAGRTRRTRAAVDALLDDLGAALEAHDDAPVSPRDTWALVRRWIEERTFAVAGADGGVQLLDADAAVYGVFDHVRIVGLLEGEWPEPSARDIFYPAFLLERLGWAEERTRTAALRARLADLLALPHRFVGVSVPELDNDAVVRPSSLLDELQAFGVDRQEPLPPADAWDPVTREEALLATPAVPHAPVLGAEARDWAAWRLARPAPPPPGQTAPAAGERYGVTAIETYMQCPFQYFAGRVLGLREDAEDEAGLPAREAGLFLHDVLRDCYEEWRRLGRTTIGVDDLPVARAVFAGVADRALQQLPPADRAVERVRLFGSAVSAGALEKVLRVEVEVFGDVQHRSLEHPIDDEVDLPDGEGTRRLHLRGRVDRVDFTEDGRVRVVDYKLGRRPSTTLQPGVYALAVAGQQRQGGAERGIAPSGYIALREDAPWIEAAADEADAAESARTLVDAVRRIEAGEFPVRPLSEFRCQFCDFASVCRKDYVGDA